MHVFEATLGNHTEQMNIVGRTSLIRSMAGRRMCISEVRSEELSSCNLKSELKVDKTRICVRSTVGQNPLDGANQGSVPRRAYSSYG